MRAKIDVSLTREQVIEIYNRFIDDLTLDCLPVTIKTDLRSIRFDSRYRDVISGHNCTDSVESVTAVLKTASDFEDEDEDEDEDPSAEYDEP